eukprot:SAG31_NODE_340_length_17466_cov_5.689987_7_plen_82_part_00
MRGKENHRAVGAFHHGGGAREASIPHRHRHRHTGISVHPIIRALNLADGYPVLNLVHVPVHVVGIMYRTYCTQYFEVLKFK